MHVFKNFAWITIHHVVGLLLSSISSSAVHKICLTQNWGGCCMTYLFTYIHTHKHVRFLTKADEKNYIHYIHDDDGNMLIMIMIKIHVSRTHMPRGLLTKHKLYGVIRLQWINVPRQQSSWGQYGAHLGPVGPRWAPCLPHEPCSQGWLIMTRKSRQMCKWICLLYK